MTLELTTLPVVPMPRTRIQVHPLYKRYAVEQEFRRRAYEGGEQFIRYYLFQYSKETDEAFRDRRARAYYPNHMRAIVDTYAAHLYRDAISRESASETLSAVWKDIDLTGLPADEFFERAAQVVQRDGRALIMVDRWDAGGEVLTRQQEEEAGRRPYAYLVEWRDVVNWDVDRRGELNWLVVREHVDLERDPLSPDPESPERYRIWTRESWKLVEMIEEDSEDEDDDENLVLPVVIDEGDHPVRRVPAVPIFFGKRHGVELHADSALLDLAPQGRRLMNLGSMIDEQIYAHVFSIMAAPESTYESLQGENFSVAGVIPYADDVSTPPHYISPDVGQIQAIREEVKATEEQVRALSGMGRVNETKSVNTGIALSYLTLDKDAMLAKFAERMRRGELAVAALALAWMGEPMVTEETSVTYPSTFDPTDLRDDLDAALKVVALGVEGPARGEVIIAALRGYLADRVESTRLAGLLEQIRQEFDGADGVTPTAGD